MRYCEHCRASFQALRTCPRDKIPTRADIEDPLVGHVMGDRYRVLERIAAGGMGQVYRAAHTRIASLFAIKVLYGDVAYEPTMQSRFAREAEVVSCLQSRHIVRVVDFGEDELLYLAMEYLDGPSLASVIARDGRFHPRRAVEVARQIARGLAHAHERGVIHRDLKSANVMIVAEDDEPEVAKLLDFGIARMRGGSRMTEVGMVMGTPHYMAPEQFVGSDVDARADLYALGVILYEMLAGALPFDEDSVLEMARRHATSPPPPLTAIAGDPDARGLERIVGRLLAKAPDDRFPSARALLDSLRELDRPVSEIGSEPTVAAGLRHLAVTEPIRSAITVGAPLYNAGDHAGCARVYRETASSLLQLAARADVRTAMTARLELALERATGLDPTGAAWELRYAFDDLQHAAGVLGATPHATDLVAAELAVLSAVTAPRYAAGQLDLVGDYHLRFAARLAERLRQAGAEPGIAAALESLVKMGEQAGGGQRALVIAGSVLEALRGGNAQPSSGRILPEPLSSHACAELAHVASHLVQAIAVGAPAFNSGQPEACLRIYRQTAIEALPLLAGAGCQPVRRLLEEAVQRADACTNPTDGAWALRHAFDHILASAPV